MKVSAAGFLALILVSSVRGEDAVPGHPVDDSAYETDRPGEVENPFAVPPGQAELVNYVVGANAAAREDLFGRGGAAVFTDTAVRFGVATRLEGLVSIDSFLRTNPSDDNEGGSNAGFGYATLLAKWNFLKDPAGDFGLAVAPFVRLPLDRSIGGSAQSTAGLVVPFDFDLEGGWELEGSTSVARTPEGSAKWSTPWENQASLQRNLTTAVAAYVELQLESGDGPAAWATEFGVTCRLNRSLLIDLGCSLGIGQNSHGRMGYAGLGWHF